MAAPAMRMLMPCSMVVNRTASLLLELADLARGIVDALA